jgi:beta-glucosidase
MLSARFQFPQGFLWGTATSSHQVEGGNTNNQWHAWEQAGKIERGEVSGLAADWWGGRWREDFDRAAEAGQNAHRFSIEWSRIQPAPDRWDDEALDHYGEMAQGALARGMQPVLTLHHFTHPLWLEELGGWEYEGAAALFEAYTRRVVAALKEHVSLWCTINEPNILVIVGYVVAYFPPQVSDVGRAFTVAHNLLRAHAASYHAIHELQPTARVGLAHHYRGIRPARPGHPVDRFLARFQSRFFNDFFADGVATGKLRLLQYSARVPQAAGTQDYFGLNYYTEDQVRFAWRPAEAFGARAYAEDADMSPHDFMANQPLGFRLALLWANRYRLPIIVTENGAEDNQDDFRRRYLLQQVQQLWRMVNVNTPIEGYFHWSLVDNFEWDRGWQQRFGLWELDIDTQERRKRPSADLYAAICKANGFSTELVQQYAPEVFDAMFPV